MALYSGELYFETLETFYDRAGVPKVSDWSKETGLDRDALDTAVEVVLRKTYEQYAQEHGLIEIRDGKQVVHAPSDKEIREEIELKGGVVRLSLDMLPKVIEATMHPKTLPVVRDERSGEVLEENKFMIKRGQDTAKKLLRASKLLSKVNN